MARRKLTADDDVRIVGGMRLLKRKGEIDIASNREWLLVFVADTSFGDWRNFKLFRQKRGPKRLWHLSWRISTQSIGNHPDVPKLIEYYPRMFEWAKAKILERMAEEEENAA